MAKNEASPSVTGDRSALLAAVAVSSVVEARNTIPILSNMVIEARGEQLVMRASDLDIEIAVAVRVAEPGANFATTVEAKKLAGLIQSFDDGSQVQLTLTGDTKPFGGNRLEVKSGRSKFNLHVLPRDDFPLMAFEPGPVRWEVAGKVLADLLDRLAFAQSDEETRYYLNGIFLRRLESDGRMQGAASNGAVVACLTIGEGPEGWPGVIIPKKLVARLRGMLKDVDETVEISLTADAKRMRIEWGDWSVTSKMVEGTFPDFTRVIPPENGAREVIMDAPWLVKAAKRIAGVASEKTQAIAMDCAKERLTLSCTSIEGGSGEEEVPADCPVEGFRLGINRKYLVSTVEAASGDSVRITMPEDARGPIRFEATVGKDFLAVVMPMNA